MAGSRNSWLRPRSWAADLADVLAEADEDERVEIVKLLPPALSGSALWELPEEEHAEDTLAALEPGEAAEIVEGLPDDDAADLLGELEPEEQRRILAEVEDPEQREEVADLLQYDSESAGGLMTSQVVTVREHDSVAQALDDIRRQADELEDFSEAYVVDGEGRLKGLMSFKRLAVGSGPAAAGSHGRSRRHRAAGNGPRRSRPVDGPLHAAIEFVAAMPPDVRIGLETFADRVTVLAPPTTDRALLAAQIGSIVADGDTALYDVVVGAGPTSRRPSSTRCSSCCRTARTRAARPHSTTRSPQSRASASRRSA